MTKAARSSESEETGRQSRAGTLRLLRWPLVIIALGVLAYLAVARGCRMFEQGQEQVTGTLRDAGNTAAAIAEGFRSGTITTTFVSSLPQLVPDGGLKLELAAYESVETFTRSDTRRVLWDVVDLGTTTTEIRVPVTFRYHLRLNDPWHLVVRGHSCVVHAPSIRPTLPPAVHLDRLERQSERGWARFNVDEQMQELEHYMAQSLELRARNETHIDLVREQCRVRVAEFVRNWLLKEDHWREDRFSSVVVIFGDEELAAEIPQPTLRIDSDHRPLG